MGVSDGVLAELMCSLSGAGGAIVDTCRASCRVPNSAPSMPRDTADKAAIMATAPSATADTAVDNVHHPRYSATRHNTIGSIRMLAGDVPGALSIGPVHLPILILP
eukprot:CAMPEP_0117651448 /NCGR_PEP_ID=MMETSP0804-20121206/2099_1 /TAXON_ID=1074897 /ORGANISM="Tetraselmis astigmatica, Strain CCMP880" /LENGTH=105 /DNA_ID=CAMNT_0005457429 /DNA_START=1516 /DNA_END=1830 /DNA_ORIENTATION=+